MPDFDTNLKDRKKRGELIEELHKLRQIER